MLRELGWEIGAANGLFWYGEHGVEVFAFEVFDERMFRVVALGWPFETLALDLDPVTGLLPPFRVAGDVLSNHG